MKHPVPEDIARQNQERAIKIAWAAEGDCQVVLRVTDRLSIADRESFLLYIIGYAGQWRTAMEGQ